MKERPILFKPEMVAAILEGRKTQTRRVVKEAQGIPPSELYGWHPEGSQWKCQRRSQTPGLTPFRYTMRCPYGQVGDRLWVRERHRMPTSTDAICVFSDGEWVCLLEDDRVERHSNHWGWITSPEDYRVRPSIHMPKWACRLWLEITEVRVERVQEISVDDVRAEGIKISPREIFEPLRGAAGFKKLWDSINGKDSWESNPWVWVVGFKVVSE